MLDDMLRREPDLRWVHGFRMQMLASVGRVPEACRVGEEIVAGKALDVNAPNAAALGHALLGRRDELLATVSGEFESFCWYDPEAPEWLAGWFALVGETDRAFRWLQRWVDRGSINYPMLARGDPMLEPLRGDPRFQRLLDRVRPEWESFVPRFEASA